jgi:plastocyanin
MGSSVLDSRIVKTNERKPQRRIFLRIAIVAVVAAIAALLTLLPDPIKAASAPVVVKMTDASPFYAPSKITIKSGDTVQWVNDGSTVHSVSTDASNAQNPKDTSMPKGAAPFDSGFIPPGGNYSYTFKVPGMYHYYCLPHEKAGMSGVIVVKK